MELDDLKKTWNGANNQEPNQTLITLKMINQVTQTTYKARLKKIAYPEVIGTIISLIGAAYIVLNLYRLNSMFLQSLAIIAVLILLALPVMSLTILRRLTAAGDVNKPVAETLKRFAIQKLRFFKFQKLSLLLSYILLVLFVILIPNFFGTKSMHEYTYFWIFSICIGYIFLSFFSKWVLKSYTKSISQAEELLVELDS